ncbi:hypothetical protein P8918_12815 [Bacillus spizizenii]|nr:hypothetical protein [Bacillus spizizenii]MCY8890451.1 hypothetical protein [Bacillus spizizenii]MEC0841906.1 hypothetical protein [Bacillus spizizenii]
MTVIIFSEGGIIQEVLSDEETKVIVVDRDIEDLSENDITTVLGSGAYVFNGISKADVQPDTVSQVIKETGL